MVFRLDSMELSSSLAKAPKGLLVRFVLFVGGGTSLSATFGWFMVVGGVVCPWLGSLKGLLGSLGGFGSSGSSVDMMPKAREEVVLMKRKAVVKKVIVWWRKLMNDVDGDNPFVLVFVQRNW